MKLQILDAKKAAKGDVMLPKQFQEPLREDIIARAVRAVQANARQPYGADPMAGKRASAELSRRRRKYRGSYGKGISRVPRKILTRRGTQMYMVGAFAPGTVGGRRAHPPKAEKSWTQKVNERENRKAIRSAMSAAMNAELVRLRGHKIPQEYPFIIDDSLEKLSKTSDVEDALVTLGFAEELDRASKTTTRAGRATMRGRRTKRPTSVLIVTAADAPLLRAAANVAGATAIPVNALSASLLAPGTHPGRATLFTTASIKRLTTEGLFLDTGKKPKRGTVEEGTHEKSDEKKTSAVRTKPSKKESKSGAATKPAKKGAAA